MKVNKPLRLALAADTLREGTQDIRSVLLPLIQPDLSDLDGQIFSPSELAKRLNASYQLNLNASVIEAFIPLFLQKGWLIRLNQKAQPEAFVVNCKTDQVSRDQQEQFFARSNEITLEFREYIRQLDPLASVRKGDDELLPMLVDWIGSIDIFDDRELQEKKTVERVGRKLAVKFETIDNKRTDENEFLVARFVSYLFDKNSHLIPFLNELVGVSLITEIVKDFQKPSGPVTKTDLAVYLDAPLALEYIGLSGSAAKKSITEIISRLTAVGASIRVYRISVEEMVTNLQSLLKRSPDMRDGATQKALARGEVTEAYARQAAANMDTILKQFGVGIVEDNENTYPNSHVNFPRNAIDDIYSRVNWLVEDRPRWHDALICGLTMRKRAGARSNDLFSVKHVVLTHNARFSSVVRRACVDLQYLTLNQVSPVIHVREGAVAAWLRAGAGQADLTIPQNLLYNACARALGVSRDFVEKVKRKARSLTPEKQEQFELLLQIPKTSQLLLDITLGDVEVIDPNNVGDALQRMQDMLTEKVRKESDRQLEFERQAAEAKLREAEEAKTSALAQAGNAQASAERVASHMEAVRSAAVTKAESNFNVRWRAIQTISVIVVSIFLFLPLFAEVAEGSSKVLAVALSCAFTAFLTFFGPLHRFVILPRMERARAAYVEKRLKELNFDDNLGGQE